LRCTWPRAAKTPNKPCELTTEELKIRQDIFTLDAAAWALAKAGQTAEAWPLMQKALAEGTRDARLHSTPH
jgi:hypothetical protein